MAKDTSGQVGGEITELYRKHRPQRFKQVVGQNEAVRMLEEMVRENRVPHALLFTGPSGTGKTTLARIVSNKLGCPPQLEQQRVNPDFVEVNCADDGGLDMVRAIRQRMTLAPLGGSPARVWLLDEVQSLSRSGYAQQALLKILEDTPPHVYFMLCTTDATKLIKTIHTRCTEVRLAPIQDTDLGQLLQQVAGLEGVEISEALVDRICESSEGSARKALVLLNQVLGLESDEERIESIVKGDTRRQSIELCRALINPRTKWAEAAAIIKNLKDEDPEQIRRQILGYATSVLLGQGQKLDTKAYLILTAFEGNFFDSGKAGLVRAAYEVMQNR